MSILPSPIIGFYLEAFTDHKKRYLKDILNFSYEELEYTHDYIQWLFPLKEASKFNEDAPLLTNDNICNFNKDEILQDNLRKSFNMMYKFYMTTSDWLTEKNHNFMRISRILESCRILGLQKESELFFSNLEVFYRDPDLQEIIGSVTFSFWKKAAGK